MNGNLNTVFGAAARDARLRLGLTQADVADRVGIAMEVYSRMERGKMLPRAQNLRRLCDVLSVSADALLGVGPGPSPVSPRATPRQEDSLELRRLVRTLRELEPRQLKAVARVVRTVVSVMPPKPAPESPPTSRKKPPAPGRKRRAG
ncbi:helix-turn-helix domain-containing protein [Corallococcus carmarthensis]|uniref:XRE family transcriptional regulator n=1 Tax=Corallococcus carmarthensis TaxID=2316728 RepID=A0A3A8K8X6_9BACT|nr:helix-turn-helix transcriptional regulator [Corallococcus carmarthensis]NOK16654.1 helix-turn-helix transcriptional regulator [Corallococcus carmarthensis]RKH03747.1 XRE family transcriptional regulator [Corallococcus carmarthensis]